MTNASFTHHFSRRVALVFVLLRITWDRSALLEQQATAATIIIHRAHILQHEPALEIDLLAIAVAVAVAVAVCLSVVGCVGDCRDRKYGACKEEGRCKTLSFCKTGCRDSIGKKRQSANSATVCYPCCCASLCFLIFAQVRFSQRMQSQLRTPRAATVISKLPFFICRVCDFADSVS